MKSKAIRMWRCFRTRGQSGLHVWFDPSEEVLTLRDLTDEEKSVTLDKRSSVSGMFPEGHSEESDGCEGSSEEELLRQLSLFGGEVAN